MTDGGNLKRDFMLGALFFGTIVLLVYYTISLTGFTLTECQGHSTSTERDVFQAARDLVVGFVPRVRVDVVLEDDAVAGLLDRLRGSCGACETLGAWMVTDVLEFGRL